MLAINYISICLFNYIFYIELHESFPIKNKIISTCNHIQNIITYNFFYTLNVQKVLIIFPRGVAMMSVNQLLLISPEKRYFYWICDVCAQSCAKYQKGLYWNPNEFNTWAYTSTCCASYGNLKSSSSWLYIYIYRFVCSKCYGWCELTAILYSFVLHNKIFNRICQVFLLIFFKRGKRNANIL